MKPEQVRQARDWAMLNRLDIPEENELYDLDNYRRRTAAFEAFVAENVVSPAGELLFDGREYVWTTNSFLTGIKNTQRQHLVNYFKKHNRKLYYLSMVPMLLIYAAFILPFLLGAYLNQGTSLPSVLRLLCVVVSFLVLLLSSIQLIGKIEDRIFWAEEKYTENYEFYTRWEYAKNAFITQGCAQQWAAARYARYDIDFHVSFGSRKRDVSSWDASARYKWKNVGKDKFIIVDKTTGKEPPLLPGAKPYNI